MEKGSHVLNKVEELEVRSMIRAVMRKWRKGGPSSRAFKEYHGLADTFGQPRRPC